MTMLYLWTNHGTILQVATEDAAAATRQVEQAGHGKVLEVMTAAQWAAYNKLPADLCTCGEQRAICGGWCVVGGMP